MKTIQNLLIASVLSILPSAAWACHDGACAHASACQGSCGQASCPHHAAMDDDHGTYFLDYADSLGLTQDQISTLNKIRNDARKAEADLTLKIQKAWMELGEAAHGAKPNKKAMEKSSKTIGELKGKMILSHAMSLSQARAVLTPEQQKKITDAHASIGTEAKKTEAATCH